MGDPLTTGIRVYASSLNGAPHHCMLCLSSEGVLPIVLSAARGPVQSGADAQRSGGGIRLCEGACFALWTGLGREMMGGSQGTPSVQGLSRGLGENRVLGALFCHSGGHPPNVKGTNNVDKRSC